MNSPMNATHVFYAPGSTNIIDTASDENPPRGHYSGETLGEMRKRYPEAIHTTYEEAARMIDEAVILPVSEIDERRFWGMLEVLPPLGWKQETKRESFKVSEMYCGNITTICARIGDRYFEMRDKVTTPHAEIMRRCNEFMKGL